MSKTITLSKAVAFSLKDLMQPIVTNYQIGNIIFQLYLTGKYQGISLRTKKHYPDFRDYQRVVSSLLKIKMIKKNKDFSSDSVFDIQDKHKLLPEVTVCIIDPFSYISHLSAMFHHGLTKTTPQMVYLSSPPLAKWKYLSLERMKKKCLGEFEQYYATGLPRLSQIKLKQIDQMKINRYSSVNIGSFKTYSNKKLRIATIERTFLDMLRKPNFCGGMLFLISVYKQHVKYYLNPVVNEIDKYGTQIEKIRAGYILEECCNLKNETIDSWTQFAQRGGSRKLDPDKPYSPTYSERWCLSLNIN